MKPRLISRLHPFPPPQILRNVLALQQSVKTLVDDPSEADFQRGRTFWNLFFGGPDELLATLKIGKPQFAFEEVRRDVSLSFPFS